VAPGVHVPVHTPAVHDWVHCTGLPQLPIAVHVSTEVPTHCVASGTHTPVQTPSEHA
jgi:hypothetical protein